MGDRYAEIEDLYRHGVPRGSLVSPSRIIDSVDVSGNRLVCEGHGLADDTEVTIVPDPGATLPAPLVVLTTYYARVVSEAIFELAATAGGSAINITDDGDGLYRLHVPIAPALNAALEEASREVSESLTGHEAPFVVPYPKRVVAMTAKLAASSVLNQFGIAGLDRIHVQADKIRDYLAKAQKVGLSLRDDSATPEANLAKGASGASTSGRWSGLGSTL